MRSNIFVVLRHPSGRSRFDRLRSRDLGARYPDTRGKLFDNGYRLGTSRDEARRRRFQIHTARCSLDAPRCFDDRTRIVGEAHYDRQRYHRCPRLLGTYTYYIR